MVMLPRFICGLNPAVPPMVDEMVATAGSRPNASTTASCRCRIAPNETSGLATVLPWIRPVSSVGRNPLGTTPYSQTVRPMVANVINSISLRQRSAQSSVRA